MLEEAKKRRAAQLQSMQENQEAKQDDLNDPDAEVEKPEFNVHMQLFGFSTPAVALETERLEREESNRKTMQTSMLNVLSQLIKEEEERLRAKERDDEEEDE